MTCLKRALLVLALGLVALIAGAKTKISFWAVTGSLDDVALYRRLATDFTAKTGIDVEVTPLAWGSFETKYFASMAAGLPPDVGITNLGGPYKYGSVGGVVDLNTAFPDKAKALASHFDPKTLTMFSDGNRLYGVPADLSTLVMYYRTDVFQRLGIKPPSTWSELDKAVDQIEAKGYRYYFGFILDAQWALPVFTAPYGKIGIDRGPDGAGRCNWNDPDYQKGVFEAIKLWHTHDTPGRDLDSRVPGMFASDKPEELVPLMANIGDARTQIAITHPEIDGRWTTIPWPKADDGVQADVMGGTAYVVFSDSKHKDEAFQWVEYMNTLDVQRQIVADKMNRGDNSSFSISPLLEMYEPANDPYWQDKQFAKVIDFKQVVAHAVHGMAAGPPVPGADESGKIESKILDRMSAFTLSKMDEIAGRLNISRTQFIHRSATGEFGKERQELYDAIKTQLKTEYSQATPQAEQLLKSEEEKYTVRYGRILGEIESYKHRGTALDVGKTLTLILIGLGLLGIAFVPKLRQSAGSYGFIAMPVLLCLVFVYLPALVALYLSLTEYHPVMPLSTARFVGFDNYREVFAGGELGDAVIRTVFYGLMTLPTGIILSLIFAYLLNQNLKGEKLWRFLYFSPLVTSIVSVSLIFSQLFLSGPQGWLNAGLLATHLVKDPLDFLGSEKSFLTSVAVVAIWQGLAFTILIFLAGLQQIPTALYEAAEIDGASRARCFWNIALPGLRPQIFLVSTLGFIGTFQVFESIYLLAGKSGNANAKFGPNDSGQLMVPYVYRTAFENFEMGKASAIAYILFVILLALTLVQFFVYRAREARA